MYKVMSNLTKKTWFETKTIALGGGDWAIEVYNEDGNFVKEFVGPNGTKPDEEAADLWAEYNNSLNSLPD
jgi:hypothetical protein